MSELLIFGAESTALKTVTRRRLKFKSSAL